MPVKHTFEAHLQIQDKQNNTKSKQKINTNKQESNKQKKKLKQNDYVVWFSITGEDDSTISKNNWANKRKRTYLPLCNPVSC